MDLESQLPGQRSMLYQPPPSSVYDEDPGIMSEVETSATGFRRGGKARSSLPVVRTPSKTQERPLGLVFLQYQSETKRALLPNEITSMDTVRALFVRSFPKQLSMEYLDSPHIRVYIHDPAKDMFYELEDLRDIRDRSVLRIYEQDANGGVYGGGASSYDADLSYFSEPEFDSDYPAQHVHRANKASKGGPPSMGYYGTLPPQYLPPSRTQTLPHSASMRSTYSPDRQKTPGGTLPPPKPQRSFQQSLTPLAKGGVRSTPPPTGPPPSIPSPRTGQPRTLVPMGSMSPERRIEPVGGGQYGRPYSVAGGGPYDPSGYLSSPERRGGGGFYSGGSSYEDSLYGGLYGTRSGSVTPVIDEEASVHRLRMEYMERQLASLTGLVQKALTVPPSGPPQPKQQFVPTRDSDGNIKVTLTPEMYAQLRHLRKQTRDLRLEVRNLRRVAHAHSVTARDTVKDTAAKIKTLLSASQPGSEDKVCAERLKVSRDEDNYRLDVSRLEKDLTELESSVEELRSNVINRKCRVNMSDVEGMAHVLSRASKTVADLKARFPNLQDTMKSVMAAEMEVVVREEKFLKEEPDRLEIALRRCKKLTGTLVTLKRLASVQEQRTTSTEPLLGTPPPRSASADSSSEHAPLSSNHTSQCDPPHTVLAVPPAAASGGGRETALDALLDELQTFAKPLEQQATPRDPIPGLLGPPRRLPSYPSAESPVRSPNPPAPQPQQDVSAFRPPANKVQVSCGDGRTTTASPDLGNVSRVSVGEVPKKAPPPPPPRTTSRSPMTSPTAEHTPLAGGRDQPQRANSAPEESSGGLGRRGLAGRSASEQTRPSAIAEENGGPPSTTNARKETLSSNSSSSESVNSQEGIQQQQGVGKKTGPPPPPRTRQDALEQRHQELLRKQKQLQDQYTRLQQLQSSQALLRASPGVGDLKKTGSESNILARSALALSTPSTGGSLTHLGPSSMPPSAPSKGGPAVPAKPQHKNKIYETDIL